MPRPGTPIPPRVGMPQRGFFTPQPLPTNRAHVPTRFNTPQPRPRHPASAGSGLPRPPPPSRPPASLPGISRMNATRPQMPLSQQAFRGSAPPSFRRPVSSTAATPPRTPGPAISPSPLSSPYQPPSKVPKLERNGNIVKEGNFNSSNIQGAEENPKPFSPVKEPFLETGCG